MSFSALFIALLIERFFDCSHLRRWDWFGKYQRLILQKLPGKSALVSLAAIVLPLTLGVFVIEHILSHTFFGFVRLAVSVLIILYCFGPRNLWADTYACLTAMTEGDAAALAEKLKVSFGITDTSNPQAMHKQWINTIFIQANQRAFANIVWFGFFGLFGVLLYRLVSVCVPEVGGEDVDPQVSQAARQVQSYLDWPSVRVMGFVFALGGHFNRVFQVWRTKAMQGPEVNDALLTECGIAAMATAGQETLPIDGSAEKEELGLLDRAFVIVMIVVAVLVYLIP